MSSQTYGFIANMHNFVFSHINLSAISLQYILFEIYSYVHTDTEKTLLFDHVHSTPTYRFFSCKYNNIIDSRIDRM